MPEKNGLASRQYASRGGPLDSMPPHGVFTGLSSVCPWLCMFDVEKPFLCSLDCFGAALVVVFMLLLWAVLWKFVASSLC